MVFATASTGPWTEPYSRACPPLSSPPKTRISANDRFIDGVETSGRANHFRNCTHSREPHEITDVILAFEPLNNLYDALSCDRSTRRRC